MHWKPTWCLVFLVGFGVTAFSFQNLPANTLFASLVGFQEKSALDHLPTVGEKGVVPPRILKRAQPEDIDWNSIPPNAIIIIEAAFRKDGTVTDIHVVRDPGHGSEGFVAALKKALLKWEFIPGQVNGKPADVRMYFKIDFAHYL